MEWVLFIQNIRDVHIYLKIIGNIWISFWLEKYNGGEYLIKTTGHANVI